MVEIDSIYKGDCMSLLSDIDDDSVDLTILDPNYDDWDKLCSDGLIEEAIRVTKLSGNILMFTKQPFDYELRNEIDEIFRREIIWTFSNGGAWVSNKMPLVSFQKIFWCTLSDEFYFDPRTGMGYSSDTKDFKRDSKVFGGYKEEGRVFTKSDEGIWLRDHLHYEKPNCGAIPAKPMSLIRIFLRCFCPEGGIVFDPFMGSGNIELSCIKEKRHYVGFEVNAETFSLAKDRIESEKRQLNLF